MVCSITQLALSILMKHLVIGQRQKAANFSTFHWSPHVRMVFIGGKVSLPGLSCHDVTDRVFPYNLGFTVYLRRCYGRYGGKCR